MLEVEQEPSPREYLRDSSKLSSPKRVSCAPSKPAHGSSHRVSLLEHAFGTQMLRGHGEWRDVSDVVRSSFLVIAKELKRQDARLRALEAGRGEQVKGYREAAEGGRWELVQKQVALLGDELKLLTRQLSSSSINALAMADQNKAAVQREQQRHDRLKKRVAGLEDAVKTFEERAEEQRKAPPLSPPPVPRSTIDTATTPAGRLILDAVSKESRRVKKSLEASVLPKISVLEMQIADLEHKASATTTSALSCSLKEAIEASVRGQARSIQALERSQQQCKTKIRELLSAFAAQRTMSEESSSQQLFENRADLARTTVVHPALPREDSARNVAEKKRQQRASDRIHNSNTSSRDCTPPTSRATTTVASQSKTPQLSLPAAAPSHSKLKERFVRERERQRENLNQLRQQCGRQH